MRKTFKEYVAENMGKKIRDGQCVALIRDHVEVCHGIPHTGSVDGAIDLWKTRRSNPFILKHFDIVEGRPEPGDIIFFIPTSTNRWGHVAIVLEDRGDGFNVLDQDGLAALFEEGKPGGRKGTVGMKISFWTWTRYAGALRPKKAA
jgi:hypothetical protein